MSHLSKSIVLFLALNIICFTLVSSCGDCEGGSTPLPPKHHPKPYHPTPIPTPIPTPSTGGSPPFGGNCPRDTLELGACANVLNLLKIGNPPTGDQCCPLIQGLIDAGAAVCLCTGINLGLLGLSLNIPVDLALLVNYCGCQLPRGFQCS